MSSTARPISSRFAQAGRAPTILTTDGAPRVRVVDADPALVALIGEWLGEAGCLVVGAAGPPGPADDCELVVVDVAYPRSGGREQLQRVAHANPGRPILALSTNFFSGVDCHGPIAREIGATCVLAKPFARDALIRTVHGLLGRSDAPGRGSPGTG